MTLATEHAPALVLMDIRLPDIDGVEALRRLRVDARTASIPVLAVTAQAMQGDRERFLEAGFDGYLSKPVDLDELVAAVEASHPGPRPSTLVLHGRADERVGAPGEPGRAEGIGRPRRRFTWPADTPALLRLDQLSSCTCRTCSGQAQPGKHAGSTHPAHRRDGEAIDAVAGHVAGLLVALPVVERHAGIGDLGRAVGTGQGSELPGDACPCCGWPVAGRGGQAVAQPPVHVDAVAVSPAWE